MGIAALSHNHIADPCASPFSSLFGRSSIGAHGQRNAFGGTDRDLTDHGHHDLALRRSQASGNRYGWTQLGTRIGDSSAVQRLKKHREAGQAIVIHQATDLSFGLRVFARRTATEFET